MAEPCGEVVDGVHARQGDDTKTRSNPLPNDTDLTLPFRFPNNLLSSHQETAVSKAESETEQQTRASGPLIFSPSGPPWGFYKIPEKFDESGKMVEWTTAVLQKVESDKAPAWEESKGGSDMQDSYPSADYYLHIPPCRTPSPVDSDQEELEEQRSWYITNNVTLDYNESEASKNLGYQTTAASDEPESNTRDPLDTLTSSVDYTSYIAEKFGLGNGPTSISDDEDCGEKDSEGDSSADFDKDDDADILSNSENGIAGVDENVLSANLAQAQSHGHEVLPNSESEISQASAHEDPLESDCMARDDSVGSFDSFESIKTNSEPKDCPPFAPEVHLRLLISTPQGGTVRIDPPKLIVTSLPGKTELEEPWSIENLSKTCWNLIKNERITSVLAFSPPGEPSPVFNFGIQWIQNNARPAMEIDFPPIEHYVDIQNVCNASPFSLDPEDIEFFYLSLDRMHAHCLLSEPLAPHNGILEEKMADGNTLIVDERNLSVSQFIKRVFVESKIDEREFLKSWGIKTPGIIAPARATALNDATMVDHWDVPEHVSVPSCFNHYREIFDLQRIDWQRKVGYHPQVVRAVRDQKYLKYYSRGGPPADSDILVETLNAAHFVPKAMHTKYKASTPHFQLRNLMACKDQLNLVYASDSKKDHSKVFRITPYNSTRDCIIDLSQTSNDTLYAEPVKISTLALSTDRYREVCMVGGFEGEYAYRNSTSEDPSTVIGFATRASGGIINHIDIDTYSSGGAKHAVMSCNDNKIRILDCETNTFLNNPTSSCRSRSGELAGFGLPWAVNCTAPSPDGRLRVVVGDSPDVFIINAEAGCREQRLSDHSDWGFACAWSPDGLTVATANQDKMVNIYDVRTWRVLTSFTAAVAGYSSMKFSPVGGGARCLLLAEPADRVTVVNAQNYEECNTQEFYGEIVGIDFIADGSGFWVANADEKFGGFMEFERRGYGQQYGLQFTRKREIEDSGDEYREERPSEWIREDERESDARCVDPGRTGALGNRTARIPSY